MKYKVSDVVKIKSLKWYEENKDVRGDIYIRLSNHSKIIFNSIMANFCGKNVTIKNELGYKYLIEEDGHGWFFTDDMFEESIPKEVVEEVKLVYKTASVEFKSVLEDTFGKEFFVEDIREKIKTVPDSIRTYRINHSDVGGTTIYLSKKHAEYIDAYVTALYVSDALNDFWSPDWNNMLEMKWSIGYNNMNKSFESVCNNAHNWGAICFKSKSLAEYFIKQFPDICKTIYQ